MKMPHKKEDKEENSLNINVELQNKHENMAQNCFSQAFLDKESYIIEDFQLINSPIQDHLDFMNSLHIREDRQSQPVQCFDLQNFDPFLDFNLELLNFQNNSSLLTDENIEEKIFILDEIINNENSLPNISSLF